MLKTRIIPCLDVKDGRVVKGVRFVDLTDAGDPVEAANAYDAAGADELCFLDITASHEKRGIILDVVARTAEVCFMPVTVGGGVRTVEDVRALMLAGADKVSINTGGGRRPERSCARRRRNSARRRSSSPSTPSGSAGGDEPARWEIFTHGGRTPTGIDAVDYAVDVARLGAGEILLTSMDRDGTGDGFDLALTRTIADAVPVPVIASGGVGTLDHLVEGVHRRPRLGGAGRLDLPLRHLYDPPGQGAYGGLRGSRAARWLATDDRFHPCDLAAIVADPRPLRRSRLLHGAAARRGRQPLRPQVRRGGGRGGAGGGRRGRRGADRRSRRRALPSACHARGARRAAGDGDGGAREAHRAERASPRRRRGAARTGLMDQQSPTAISPHRVFTREEWARLRADTPLTLTDDDVTRLKSLNDPISLDEVVEIYLPISRLLSLYVAAIQSLYDATRTFLGDEDGMTPVHHRHRRLGGGRQVDDGAHAAGAAPPLAEHAQGRPDRHRRLPAAQRGPRARRADGAQGLSRRATTGRRCSPSSPTSRRASTRSRRRSIRTSPTTSCPARRSSSTGRTS